MAQVSPAFAQPIRTRGKGAQADVATGLPFSWPRPEGAGRFLFRLPVSIHGFVRARLRGGASGPGQGQTAAPDHPAGGQSLFLDRCQLGQLLRRELRAACFDGFEQGLCLLAAGHGIGANARRQGKRLGRPPASARAAAGRLRDRDERVW